MTEISEFECIHLDTRTNQKRAPSRISFIIPVYNTRDYVVNTLDSIVADGMTDIELIVVDDGSTDDSLTVITGWINQHKTPALLLRQRNGGPSAARMLGLIHAQGKYVGFCDSDDKIEISTYRLLAALAEEQNCELALCRSVVFNDLTGQTSDFYDAHVWDQILAGSQLLVTNARREPRLFRLEPNANTRLLRRDFISSAGIEHPLDLFFGEDLPPHVNAIAQANKILVLDRTGYFYRVNRIGKITEQKSTKRFDILTVASQALDAATRNQLAKAASANVLALTCKMIYWCGTHTLNKDRRSFFSQATRLVKGKVSPEVIDECIANWTDEREAILLAAFATNATDFLIAYSSGNTRPLWPLLKLLFNMRYGKVPRRVACRVVFHSISRLLRKKTLQSFVLP